MKKKLNGVLAFLLATVLAFAGCGTQNDDSEKDSSDGGDTSAATESKAQQEVSDADFDGVFTIGINDCLTGGGAVYGLPEVNAMDIAISEINEAGGVKVGDKTYKMEAIKYDNKSDPNEAVSALRKLIDRDNVKFITGWATTGSTMAAAQMMGDEDAMMLVACAGELSITTQGLKNVLRIRPPGAYTGGPAGGYVYDQGVERVAILGQMKDSMREQYTNEFVKTFEAKGGEVLTIESFEDTDKDMYTQLTKILDLNPDAIFIPGFVEPVAFAVKQARELGYEGEIYVFSGGNRSQFLTVLTEEQLDGIYDILPVEGNVEALGETAEKYNEKYKELYGEYPPPNGIYGYDAIYALKAGVEAAGTIDDVDAVAEAMRNMPVAEGVGMEYLPINGNMFDENGQCYTINIVVQWINGERVLVEKLKSDPTEFSKTMSAMTEENLKNK